MTELKDNPLVSIIIRVKNEEKWITHCLDSISKQDYKNFEIIIVDNESTDRTISKAKKYDVKVTNIEKFLPGKAINLGIKKSKGEVLVILSGHCIPVDKYWLTNLVRNLKDPDVAGVYGRQQPLSFTSALDKRDLLITFGLDRKVQVKDSFFHNANSAIRRELWEKLPFDDEATNIEDRIWGKEVIRQGYKIIYEPEASVFHHHGIHHGQDETRAKKIEKILSNLDQEKIGKNLLPEDMHIIAMIPVKGNPIENNQHSLLQLTIQQAKQSKYIDDVMVFTDNDTTAEESKKQGASVPFIRPKELSEDYVGIPEVLKYCLQEIEDQNILPDLIVVMEQTHPFRSTALIDQMIENCCDKGLDSLIAGYYESRNLLFRKDEDEWVANSNTFKPRKLRDNKMAIGLFGVCSVTHPHFIREGSVIGENFEINILTDPSSKLEIKDKNELDRLSGLLSSLSVK